MKNIFASLLCLFISIFQIKAQSEKTAIAILPFINGGDKAGNADLIQEMVTKEFVKTGRFDIVDRSKFQKVMDELKVQKNEEFLNSKIVDQGKLLGAEYLVTGVVTEMNCQSETSLQSIPGSASKTVTIWKSNIKFSYQVINVTTGKAVYTENIGSTNSATHNVTKADALDNAECLLRRQIRNAVMKEFPEDIQIVKVEKLNKKGLPDEVLISAGTNFFDDSKNECNKGLIDNINPFKKKEAVKLKVIEVEVININGKEAKREIEIGTLKVKDVQGDFTICEVTDGAKEIQAKMAGNQKLVLKIL